MKKKNNNDTKNNLLGRICGVFNLHFEGGRILPSVGKGRVAFWGEAEPGEGCTLSMRGRKHDSFPVWGMLALHFWGRKLDSFPIKDSFSLNFRDSCAFKEEESLTSSSCNDRFEGEMAVHLRWKSFKKACFFDNFK